MSDAAPTRGDRRGRDTAVRIAGTSTAWWGTILLLVVLSSMLSTLLFAYPYLGAAAERWGPASAPPLGFAAAAAAVALGSMLPAMALHRAAGRGAAPAVARWALVTAVMGLAFAGLVVGDLQASGVSAIGNAYGSVRVVTVAFHLAVTAVAILLLLAQPLRLWTGDLGPRQRTAAVCAALVWYYVVGGWATTSAMIHLVPQLR